MLHKIDAEIGVKEPPGHNNTANNDPGFCSPYERNTQKRGLFSFNPSSESNYDKFPHFQRNMLSGLDFNQLNKWLKSHKKDMSCLQKWTGSGMNCFNYTWTLDSEETNERENNLFSSMFIFKTVLRPMFTQTALHACFFVLKYIFCQMQCFDWLPLFRSVAWRY